MSENQENQENPRGARWRLPRLNITGRFRKKCRQQNLTADDVEQLEVELEEGEQLEETSRRLIMREAQLFSGSHSAEDEDELHRDLETLQVQMMKVISNTFSSSTSSGQLRGAIVSIQLQEQQDQWWAERPEDLVPMWRPQKCLHVHDSLLEKMVMSRLREAAESSDGGRLSSPLKNQVCVMGKRVRDDLLMVVRMVKDCYPPEMDIVNVYARLYQKSFSACLNDLTDALDADDCGYVLLWVHRLYIQDILQHEELQGTIKWSGSLLLQEVVDQLEEQYLTHKEDKVKSWLQAALTKEEQSWSCDAPELLGNYCFSPLAVDVLQVVDGALAECSVVIRDQNKAQRITSQLETFLSSYKQSVDALLRRNHSNLMSAIKAQLVCEEQFRNYITTQTGSWLEQQRRRCLDTLDVLKDSGFKYFTCRVHRQLKVFYSQLWTSDWLDESLPVMDLLLDSLSDQLTELSDLKDSCRQALLCDVQQEVVVQFVRRMMKMRMKSREQQVGAARLMMVDALKINNFFSERVRQGGGESSYLHLMLCSLSEILQLQDPESVHLELVGLVRKFPDLSAAHVSALLSLRTDLSAAAVRSIKRSVEENRTSGGSTDHSPTFFSGVKVKWINKMIT